MKLFVPYFTKGKIASKEVFKASAREFTHALLESPKSPPASEYPRIVEAFFEESGLLISQADAEQKISNFKRSHLT